MSAQQHRLIASYGRRRGRRLRTGKKNLMGELLPQVSITLPEQGPLDPASLFDKTGDTWLEVGFGGGEHLAHQAQLHPSINIIGCEPYIDGIAGLLTHMREHALKNIRIYTEDVRLLLERVPDASFARVFILYPDPWPKARHHKRRLVSTETLDMLARVMKPGSLLRLATDDANYCAWMLERLLAHQSFNWTAKSCDDWLHPPADWLPTRYEQKALAGRPTYLEFKRV